MPVHRCALAQRHQSHASERGWQKDGMEVVLGIVKASLGGKLGLESG